MSPGSCFINVWVGTADQFLIKESDMNIWQKIWADPKTTIPGIIAAGMSILVAFGIITPAESSPLQTALTATLGGIVALLGIFSNWPQG